MKPFVIVVPNPGRHLVGTTDHFLGLDRFLTEAILTYTDPYAEELFGNTSPEDTIVSPVDTTNCNVEALEGRQANWSGRRIFEPILKTIGREPSNISARRTIGNQTLRKMWYDPFHQKLNDMTRERVERFGGCLVLICVTTPVPTLDAQSREEPMPPLVTIACDDGSALSSLLRISEQAFTKLGFDAHVESLNFGSWLPTEFWEHRGVASVRLSIRQDFFMEVRTGNKDPQFAEKQKRIGDVLFKISDDWNKATGTRL